MISLALLVRGRSIDTYRHNGKTYVEGRKGTEYEISIYNPSAQRKKCVLSVDGLNICTGKTEWESGYLIPGGTGLIIPGWKKTDDRVAHFVFSSLKGSYNQHNLEGQSTSVGVIGCRVYNEKVKYSYTPPITQHVYHHHYNPQPFWNGLIYGGGGHWTYDSQPYNVSYTNSMSPQGLCAGKGASVNFSQPGADRTVQMDCAFASSDEGVAVASAGPWQTDIKCDSYTPQKAKAAETPLGTGWGRDTVFETKSVEFDRELNPCETILIYYDSREGLKRKGIDIIIHRIPKVSRNPEPFPNGCPPPINR